MLCARKMARVVAAARVGRGAIMRLDTRSFADAPGKAPELKAKAAAPKAEVPKAAEHKAGEPKTAAPPPPPPPPPPTTSPKPPPPPLPPKLAEIHAQGRFIMACLPKYVEQASVWKDELTLYVAPDALVPTLFFLKHHTATLFEQVVDITAVDWPSKANRFEVVYHLLSVRYNTRVRVKTWASEVAPVPSVSGLFPSANWFEREVWDMFGIAFTGHPDLRRILTDYGFEGHPLRKDFPLTGHVEVRYDDEKKRVVVEPLELAQGLRSFEALSPWEQHGKGVSTTRLSPVDSKPLADSEAPAAAPGTGRPAA